ncbi:phosphatidate cytidylyltransferase [Spectribacter hydrogenoxidans]|uniref:Phosphatidate cytidylyltransferase n=1 Tax=Spectribacter hydrogenoxidans TaxID=3075608 RepID=A0ABU3C1F3_9GAMM|nr:phosphatidate cytidylyltransferase [Salinisphaera sp. W335]MDT0635386.1 phosphatidate cytidylyltransferase [Salinisphaera sp. W335]
MLKTRILTALALLPLVVAAILWLPTAGVALILGSLLTLGAWEWGRLGGIREAGPRAAGAAVTALVMLGGWYGLVHPGLVLTWLGAALVWWAAAVRWIPAFPRGWGASLGRPALTLISGLLVLSACFVALVWLHAGPAGPTLMLLLLILIWAADTGAYFAGRALGRRKLAPNVSPGKTLEGAAGGLALTTLAGVLGAWWLDLAGGVALAFILLAVLTGAISIVGDLTQSMFKRHAGVKDSGNLFPGHGGVLDRIDSLLAAAPLFSLGLQWLPL